MGGGALDSSGQGKGALEFAEVEIADKEESGIAEF